VAANPFFSFDIAGARRGDVLTVIWRDNQQQSDRFQAAVL
jgi:hypothetical protein